MINQEETSEIVADEMSYEVGPTFSKLPRKIFKKDFTT